MNLRANSKLVAAVERPMDLVLQNLKNLVTSKII